MAEYDWIDSPEFRKAVEGRIKEILKSEGILGSIPNLTEKLVRIAKTNKEDLSERHTLSMEPPKTPLDALRSVETIMRTAVEAARRNDKIVFSGDLETAIKAHFCKVFPFCR